MNFNPLHFYLAVTNGNQLEDFIEIPEINIESSPEAPMYFNFTIPRRNKNEIDNIQKMKPLQLIMEIALLEKYKKKLIQTISSLENNLKKE